VVGQGQIVIEGATRLVCEYRFSNFFKYVQDTPPSVLIGMPTLDGDVESKSNAAVSSLR
jgi:hypothetical protein